ncbi:vacuolar membrane protease [[Candida] jaroonii]|uniref:Vacuolar membrane protease n=1 Tax=[Candida] jaroonii TaxID=467808 RepID=A0ACA9Y645_9ASCO|nr:vacuolar membrane protease [[Candida] jaroonii]
MTEPEEGPSASIISKKPTIKKSTGPNVFVRFIRSIFGYRKTSLSFFVFLTVTAVYLLSTYDNSLELSVSLPEIGSFEDDILQESWYNLQKIGEFKHPYGSKGNKVVYNHLKAEIQSSVKHSKYIEWDNDLNNTNFLFGKDTYGSVSYYESNNLYVRINGSRSDLPAILISAHYDSVPSSFGITDDGAGIASMLGLLKYYTDGGKQPLRTIVFNFNNNEEFGLYGAQTFFSHPWSEGVKYFINLEGTGQGGKAILFRGTDYGILNHYKSVRYPYASSLFQQAFNGRLIHSETDYKVYFANGLRGIDVAFYKPRDIYHTGEDSIRRTSKKALWHMLSTALDFVEPISNNEIDIDSSYIEKDEVKQEYATYVSFLNFFFITSVPKLVIINIALLVIVPVTIMFLLTIIFCYKQNWKLGFVNSIKFPISLVVSILALNFVTEIIVGIDEFLPNSKPMNVVVLLASTFFFINYLLLNGINLIFRNYKIVQHDEKLIVALQISFVYWVLLIITTVGLANNKPGNDHTGKGLLTVLYAIQSIGCIWGLLGWCFRPSKKDLEYELLDSSRTPLLVQQVEEYGAEDTEETQFQPPSDSTSLISMDSYTARKKLNLIAKTFSYDWSIQYLMLVPIPLLIFYNNGYLILQGLNKSIQESVVSQNLIFKLSQIVAITLILPVYPFIFKVNRFLVWVSLILIIQGFFTVFFTFPFDTENPMKLRFIQSANLSESVTDSYVHVLARTGLEVENILGDMPSVKESGESVECKPLDNDMVDCYYKSTKPPVIFKAKDFSDYLSVEVLKNSSDNDYPFGLLNGEIKINVKDNNMCKINFNTGSKKKELPVKTIIKYNDKPINTTIASSSIPEGFSVDKDGNYLYKDLNGMPGIELNKLKANVPYHIGFQWLPNLIDDYNPEASNILKLDITCYWTELGDDNSLVPAYQEVNHYSPKYVTWANQASGMVSVSTSVEL